MINSVILTGRLTTDVVMRETKEGTPYVFFTIAVNRKFSNNKGNKEADFIACTAWRNTAELMQKYLSKGSLIGIEGSLQVFTQQKDGNYESRTTVQVNNITFLESRNQSQNNTSGNMTFSNEQSFNQEEVTPVNKNFGNNNNTNNDIDENDINLEDLKF